MMLHDAPTKEEKAAFIKAYLNQVKDQLLADVPKMPSGFNSWHLRLLIRDRIKTYTLSTAEMEEFEYYRKEAKL